MSAKKLERLRAFFRFAQKRKWVAENPALDLKAPKISLCPTLPFSREEMVLILAATDQYKEEMPSHGIENGRRMLRYSGMRIGDAVKLRKDCVHWNPSLLRAEEEKFFFWSGRGKLESIVRSWQMRLRRLFKLSGAPNGHPHRFRDTSLECLLNESRFCWTITV